MSRRYHPDTDPTTIPDAVLKSEWGRRSSESRKVKAGGHNGGRPRTCECGTCPTCLRWAKQHAKDDALVRATGVFPPPGWRPRARRTTPAA